MKVLRDKLGLALLLSNMGELAIEQGQFLHAARLLGAADSLRRTIGASWSQTETEEFLDYRERLQSNLSEQELARAWNQGCAMNMEQTVAYALGAPNECGRNI